MVTLVPKLPSPTASVASHSPETPTTTDMVGIFFGAPSASGVFTFLRHLATPYLMSAAGGCGAKRFWILQIPAHLAMHDNDYLRTWWCEQFLRFRSDIVEAPGSCRQIDGPGSSSCEMTGSFRAIEPLAGVALGTHLPGD